MDIAITLAEWGEARAFGLKRQALKKNRGRACAAPKDAGGSWDERNALGAIAEFALAKAYGLVDLWRSTQAYSEQHAKITSDVGQNIQVRATDVEHGSLIVHDYDKKDAPYVLAIVRLAGPPVVHFAGWTWWRLACIPRFWDDRSPGFNRPGRGAYRVPQDCLFPMKTLPEECK